MSIKNVFSCVPFCLRSPVALENMGLREREGAKGKSKVSDITIVARPCKMQEKYI